MEIASQEQPASARALLRRPGYLAYWSARFLATFAVQIVSVSLGWQVYDITRDPLDLGIVGLVQFLPLPEWSLLRLVDC